MFLFNVYNVDGAVPWWKIDGFAYVIPILQLLKEDVIEWAKRKWYLDVPVNERG